jgi:ferredoxin
MNGGYNMAKVVLDQSQCIGCGVCVAKSGAQKGGNFDFDENGLSKVVDENVKETTQEAVDSCPVGAISIEE